MKLFMYGLQEQGMTDTDPYKIFIGVSAETEEEAEASLFDIAGGRSSEFVLYDIIN